MHRTGPTMMEENIDLIFSLASDDYRRRHPPSYLPLPLRMVPVPRLSRSFQPKRSSSSSTSTPRTPRPNQPSMKDDGREEKKKRKNFQHGHRRRKRKENRGNRIVSAPTARPITAAAFPLALCTKFPHQNGHFHRSFLNFHAIETRVTDFSLVVPLYRNRAARVSLLQASER